MKWNADYNRDGPSLVDRLVDLIGFQEMAAR
jgi:hypothetical protein